MDSASLCRIKRFPGALEQCAQYDILLFCHGARVWRLFKGSTDDFLPHAFINVPSVNERTRQQPEFCLKTMELLLG